MTYNVATTFTKLCLLAQYIRMFDSRGPLRRTCWAFLVVTVLWGAAFIVIAVVPCVPVSAFWDRGTGRCYGYGSIDSPALQRTYTAHNTTNVLLDLVVLAIPVPLYFEKSTPWKTRIGIGCLLMLGVGYVGFSFSSSHILFSFAPSLSLSLRFFPSSSSAGKQADKAPPIHHKEIHTKPHAHSVNLVSIWRLQTIIQTKATTYPVADPTWYGPKSIVLATIEVNLASICASIPVFWPILSQSLNKIFVTQEVHVVHQHRRLSGGEHDHRQCGYLDEGEGCAAEDHYELRASESGTTSHSRAGSESSLNLFRAKSGASVLTKLQREKERDRNHHNHYPAPPMPTLHHNHHHHNQHYSDKYVASRVAPLGDCNSNISASNEIKSDGQKGFKKEQERFGSRNGSGGGGGGGLGGGGGGGGAGFQQQPKSMFED